MPRRWLSLLAICAPLWAVDVVNHHPFAIRQPLTLGRDVWMVDVAADGRAALRTTPVDSALSAAPEDGSLRLTWRGVDYGRIRWGVNLGGPVEPLKLTFKERAKTPLYTDWEAAATNAGLVISVRARVFADGFLDIRESVENKSATQMYGAYVAVVETWDHPEVGSYAMSYDNRIEPFGPRHTSRFSKGEGRHWALQHGVDWIALGMRSGAGALILSSYSESPTTLDDTHNPRNKSPRFTGLNLPQFKNEATGEGETIHLTTEFVRSNHAYRDRFIESKLPDHGQVLTSERRIAFSADSPSTDSAEHAFIAYNSYASRTGDRVDIGVPYVTFGTSYFPYSTLGENFGKLKLPGQETDAFWPLSADTVTHWRDFADDIRRDLRIAKAMGFDIIRLHYVDVISKLPDAQQYEYLDFLFGELRHLKLQAMFSTAFAHWSPEQIAARVARYKDVIVRVELENEILIWGIPLDRPQYWGRIQAALKKAAPGIPVNLTAHLNMGIFDRMNELHVPSDAVSAHAYIDSLDAIPSGRGFALAVGQYARRAGKPAIYTEWNWRGLTRLSAEDRAKIYPPIMENLLATRSISQLYQFQFNETMCVNPATRGSILRHYEPLWLSRRPKPEAFELMRLIEQYGNPASGIAQVAIEHVATELKNGRGEAQFRLINRTGHPLRLRAAVEASKGVDARLTVSPAITIPADGSARLPVQVTLAANAEPGFYHIFLRAETADGLLRYGWAELRNAGQPKGLAGVRVDQPLAVVYRENGPAMDVETAYLVAQTLESASGHPVEIYGSQDLPRDYRNVLEVGKGPLRTYDDAVAFVLSYWRQAKDSAARKIGLVEKKLAPGVDVGALP